MTAVSISTADEQREERPKNSTELNGNQFSTFRRFYLFYFIEESYGTKLNNENKEKEMEK